MPALARGPSELLTIAKMVSGPRARAATDDRPPILVLDDFYPRSSSVRNRPLESVSFPMSARCRHRRAGSLLGTPTTPTVVEPPPSSPFASRLSTRRLFGDAAPETGSRELEAIIGERMRTRFLAGSGDHWNGAFHLVERDYGVGRSFVHPHYKFSATFDDDWSGVVPPLRRARDSGRPDMADIAGWALRRRHLGVGYGAGDRAHVGSPLSRDLSIRAGALFREMSRIAWGTGIRARKSGAPQLGRCFRVGTVRCSGRSGPPTVGSRNWSGREDSNLRPLPPEDSALPG